MPIVRARGLGASAYDTANPPLVITGDQIASVTMADLAARHVIWNGQYINNYSPLQLAQAQALQAGGVYAPQNQTAAFMYGPTGTSNTFQDIKNKVAASLGAPQSNAPAPLLATAPAGPVQSNAPAPAVVQPGILGQLQSMVTASAFGGLPDWAWLAGGLGAAWLFFGRGK